MEWIRVEDRLPEEYVRVLTYLKNDDIYRIDYVIFFGKNPMWCCTLERENYKVTHWVPITEPPKEFTWNG